MRISKRGLCLGLLLVSLSACRSSCGKQQETEEAKQRRDDKPLVVHNPDGGHGFNLNKPVPTLNEDVLKKQPPPP